QMPYGQVDKLTKLVPQNPAAPVTLAAAIAGEPKLQAFRDEDPVVARAFDIAQRLEGLTRHASTHAAGIVIADRPLSELVPLYRPGPMANIPTYCARKHGDEESEYLHPMLEPILKETFGVIIYQEQVMQIAQVMAGYSLGEADLLRRAMGKKIRKEMEQQRKRFVSGAVERGIQRGQADTIFELLAKFADYGFNKSHAAAYAL